jgi:hypothetical protein
MQHTVVYKVGIVSDEAPCVCGVLSVSASVAQAPRTLFVCGMLSAPQGNITVGHGRGVVG